MSRDQARNDAQGFDRFEEFLGHWTRRDFVKRISVGAGYAAFLAGGLEALEACANAGSGGGPAAENVKKGGHVVEVATTDIKTTNPVLVSDTASSIISGMLYDQLLSSKANGDLVPQIANLPKISGDGLTYTLTIRDGVKFTDGTPITAEDVKFTYDLMFDPKYKDVNSPRRGDLEAYVQSITAKDAKTVEFKLQKVYAPFAVLQLQYGILPKAKWASLSAKDINTSDMNANPTVTSGPWKFVKWDKGQSVTLAANKDYPGGAPNLDTYVYKVVADAVAVANQIKNSEADFGQIDSTQLASVQSSPDVAIINFPVAIFDFYMYNQNPGTKGAKLFADKAVRQALLLGLNRQAMVDSIYFKTAVVADSVEPPVTWAYNKDAKPKYPYDPAKAESMLDAAGWKKGADGIRANAAGDKLDFAIITNAGNKVRENLVVTMQDQWKKIGVSLTPKLITFPQLVSQLQNERTYDTLLVGFSWSADPDESQVFHSRNAAKGGFNGMNFKNTTVDKLLDDAVATVDQAKRKQLYFQLQDVMNDEQPAPILTFRKGIWGFSKRMQGYTDKDLGLGTYTQFQERPWMQKAWVQDGK